MWVCQLLVRHFDLEDYWATFSSDNLINKHFLLRAFSKEGQEGELVQVLANKYGVVDFPRAFWKASKFTQIYSVITNLLAKHVSHNA